MVADRIRAMTSDREGTSQARRVEGKPYLGIRIGSSSPSTDGDRSRTTREFPSGTTPLHGQAGRDKPPGEDVPAIKEAAWHHVTPTTGSSDRAGRAARTDRRDGPRRRRR